MKYWFEVEDAQRWGLPAAAVLAHLKYWIERNTSAGEEPCMTQGIKEMAEYLPFLTPSKIKRALVKLEEVEAIYRKPNGFDRRHTYCLGTIPYHAWDKTEPSMSQNRTIDGPNLDRVHIETNTFKRTESNAREELDFQRPTEEEVIEYMEDRERTIWRLHWGRRFGTTTRPTDGWSTDTHRQVETKGKPMDQHRTQQTKQ